LEHSQAKNRAISSALPDLFLIQTVDGVYLDCFCKESRNFWLRPEQVVGKDMREVLPPDLSEAFCSA
jgi:hypothetical protein